MRISLIQSVIHWNDPAANFFHFSERISQAAQAGAELAILPEMFSTGFSFLQADLAQECSIKSEEFLCQQAKKHSINLIASAPGPSIEPSAASFARPTNLLRVVGSKGQIRGTYAKLHLFSFAAENNFYQPGQNTLTVGMAQSDNSNAARVSCFICYDLRFPLPFAELAISTDIFVIVANWPRARRHHWRTLLTARAIENQAFVIGVNRVGSGGDLEYAGDSMVVSPTGETIADLRDQERVETLDLDLTQVAKYRQSFSLLADRRKDFRVSSPI